MPAASASVLRWATRLFGAAIAERVFEPLVADWEHEAEEATSTTARTLAHCRGAYAIGCTGLLLAGILAAPWRGPRALVRGVAITGSTFTLAGLAIVLLPQVALLAAEELPLALAVLAEASKLALPLAVAPCAVNLATADAVAVAHRRWLLGGLVACVVVAQVALVGWIAPAAARLERDARNRRIPTFAAIPFAPNTLSLDALLDDSPQREPLPSAVAQRVELWNRAAWIAWPPAIAFMGWRLGLRAGRRPRAAAVSAWALSLAAFLVPMLLIWWLVVGGPFGIPTLAVRFLPTELLLCLGLLLRPTRSAGA